MAEHMPKVTNRGSQEIKASIPQSSPTKGKVKTGDDLRSHGNANTKSNIGTSTNDSTD